MTPELEYNARLLCYVYGLVSGVSMSVKKKQKAYGVSKYWHNCFYCNLLLNFTLNVLHENKKRWMLLELSSAFDYEYAALLNHLRDDVDIRDTALDWFSSYLCDRSVKVMIGNSSSPSAPLTYGVPQGSLLGPILFCLYMISLGSIMRKHITFMVLFVRFLCQSRKKQKAYGMSKYCHNCFYCDLNRCSSHAAL